jgi:hypothetical protein
MRSGQDRQSGLREVGTRLSNKGMKLTKLSAAPTLAPQAALGRRCRRMPAPARGMDAGTASQLIPGVRRTWQAERHDWPPRVA